MADIEGCVRVTDILFPLSGLKQIPKEILEKAADRGSRAHSACEALMLDIGLFNIDEDIQGYVKSFEQYMPKQFLEKPDRWFCDKYKITGECDGMFTEGDDLVLFDIKTPAKESSTWNIQLSAYAYLAKKAGYPITQIEVVRLNKDGKAPEVIRYKENFDLFLNCLNVYRYFYKDNVEESYFDYI
jgi:hypothetical protein